MYPFRIRILEAFQIVIRIRNVSEVDGRIKCSKSPSGLGTAMAHEALQYRVTQQNGADMETEGYVTYIHQVEEIK